MSGCKNCFLFNNEKLNSKMGYFECRRDLFDFLINTIMNIQWHHLKYCKCNKTICGPCQIADIFKEEVTYKLYKNCFNFDLLNQVRENLHIYLHNLLEKNDHFLCKIINEKYFYVHKCHYTGKTVMKREKKKIENIKNSDVQINAKNFLKNDKLIFGV